MKNALIILNNENMYKIIRFKERQGWLVTYYFSKSSMPHIYLLTIDGLSMLSINSYNYIKSILPLVKESNVAANYIS